MADRLEVTLAGERLELLPHRALHWPARRTLLVADLHWGKAETFRVRGAPLPAGILEADLVRLDAALDATAARRLVVLGDLLHAGAGLTPDLVVLVRDWLHERGLEVLLVPGNHDRCGVPPAWAISLAAPEHDEGPFRFRHDPEGPAESSASRARRGRGTGYLLSGHVHPMVTLGTRADALRLPCFVLGRRRAVLPSFSLFTGGRAMTGKPGDRIVAIADGALVDLQARSAGARPTPASACPSPGT